MFNHENMHNLQWTVLKFCDQDHWEIWLTVLVYHTELFRCYRCIIIFLVCYILSLICANELWLNCNHQVNSSLGLEIWCSAKGASSPSCSTRPFFHALRYCKLWMFMTNLASPLVCINMLQYLICTWYIMWYILVSLKGYELSPSN